MTKQPRSQPATTVSGEPAPGRHTQSALDWAKRAALLVAGLASILSLFAPRTQQESRPFQVRAAETAEALEEAAVLVDELAIDVTARQPKSID